MARSSKTDPLREDRIIMQIVVEKDVSKQWRDISGA